MAGHTDLPLDAGPLACLEPSLLQLRGNEHGHCIGRLRMHLAQPSKRGFAFQRHKNVAFVELETVSILLDLGSVVQKDTNTTLELKLIVHDQ